ncbi:MAG TPA: hypothetical protein VGD62_10295, partial [Acidobacteriaceae bacterium]
MRKHVVSLLAACLVAATPLIPQQAQYKDPTAPMESRITNLLSQMTLDEKIDCLGTRTGVPRLGVPNFGSSEGIHGVVQRGSTNARYQRTA